MLPPKNRLATGTHAHRCAGGGGEVVGERREHPGAVLAGEDRDRRRRAAGVGPQRADS